jgi:hypothetical protein
MDGSTTASHSSARGVSASAHCAGPLACGTDPTTFSARAPHARHLLTVIPGAEGYELPAGGHLLGGEDVDAIYRWLTGAPTPR